jgi:hypothetical protein
MTDNAEGLQRAQYNSATGSNDIFIKGNLVFGGGLELVPFFWKLQLYVLARILMSGRYLEVNEGPGPCWENMPHLLHSSRSASSEHETVRGSGQVRITWLE